MLRVGLTGGIGSGKSTVAEIFTALGAPVIDTDIIAHQVTRPDGPAFSKLIEEFGLEILSADGTIDRRKLASIVFKNKEKKSQLEAILHPLIWLIVEQMINDLKAEYCIIVVPLLVEGNNEYRFDRILVIDTDEAKQVERVMQRDKRGTDETELIINSQVSRQQRNNAADDIIQNNGDRRQLIQKVEELNQKYLELARNH